MGFKLENQYTYLFEDFQIKIYFQGIKMKVLLMMRGKS